MSEQPHLRLIDRLRGQYHIPINDGAGPLNGSMTFSREFPTPPIQKEAASVIEDMLAALKKASNFILCNGDGPDDQALLDEVAAAVAKAEGISQ